MKSSKHQSPFWISRNSVNVCSSFAANGHQEQTRGTELNESFMKKKKKRIQSAFSLTSKRFINNRNISPPLTPELAGKFSHTSAAFSLLLTGCSCTLDNSESFRLFYKIGIFKKNQKWKMNFERDRNYTTTSKSWERYWIYICIYMQDLYNCQSAVLEATPNTKASERSINLS